MLTRTEKKLANLLHSRDVNLDTCIGIIVTLKTEANFKKMHAWVEKNPKARQTEIMQHLYTFMPGVPYFVMPSMVAV